MKNQIEKFGNINKELIEEQRNLLEKDALCYFVSI